MRVVILAGGTGSIALQDGLFKSLEERADCVDVKVIVNAYDNGRSTGTVRKVMNGQILGPSDVRKNQSVRCRLISPTSPWISYLDHRFTTHRTKAHALCTLRTAQLVEKIDFGTQAAVQSMLCSAIDAYFSSPAAADVEYDDFSLANIVYAGLAKTNGNSLREAARIMARAMKIPDVVLLNDDESLFLGAVTRSGHAISDEGDIVCWGNAADPIVDVFFTDSTGSRATPQLCFEAWQCLINADLIILSSGTQWSSLIPTYASTGFKAAINESGARVVMVMNRVPDKDSPGQGSSDIINAIVPRYFDRGRIHVLADQRGHASMRTLDSEALKKVASFTPCNLSGPETPRDQHSPELLATNIGYVYFKEYLQSDAYLFDYDDTLCGRGSVFPKSSQFNMEALVELSRKTSVGVCTGNSIYALNLNGISNEGDCDASGKPLCIFADGGVNKYSLNHGLHFNGSNGRFEAVGCVAPSVLLPESGPSGAAGITAALIRAGIPASKISNRGNALISIRPIENEHRHALRKLIAHLLRDSDLQVRLCGHSTVEICRPGLSKRFALEHLLTGSAATQRITYVGDECESGNDMDVAMLAAREPRIRCLHVRNPAETTFFISTLSTCLPSNVSR